MPEPDSRSNHFYRRSLEILQAADVPFLLGGAYALCIYTGIARMTKDFDLFVRPTHFEAALAAFRAAGYHAEKTFPHWLGKAHWNGDSIDLIYRAGNGLCAVDDLWFERAVEAEIFGRQARLTPPEEMIWMKAYIMERERYDGADVAHLLLHCAGRLDWDHMLWRFGPDWRVLLSHLVLFGFIYPSEKDRIPAPILDQVVRCLEDEESEVGTQPLCRGTLLSRAQYLTDVREGGFRDARLELRSEMSREEIETWTAAIDPQIKPHAVREDD